MSEPPVDPTEPWTSPTNVQYPRGYGRPLASLAQHILDTIVSQYAADGTALPARQEIVLGQVAVDNQNGVLAVMFGQMIVGLPGNEQTAPVRADSPRSSSFNVELWRPTPTLTETGAPTAEEETDATFVTLHDAWLLMEAVAAMDQLGVGVIANVTVNPPQGGTFGVSLAIELQVP